MFIKAEAGEGNSVVYLDDQGNKTIRKGGTWTWRNNNPGNLVKGSFAKKRGSIGSAGGFAIFPDVAVGRKAMRELLRIPKYWNKNIYDAIAAYAPPKENDTKNYRKLIKQITGLELKRKVSSLMPKEFNNFVAASERVEGWKVGSEEKIDIKEVIDVQKDKRGSIQKFRIEDYGWVSKRKAVLLAKKGIIDAVVVGGSYIRTRPDNTESNNYNSMG